MVAALAIALGAGPVAAAQKKPTLYPVVSAAPASARDFTINEILAKKEAGRVGLSGKIAAVELHGKAGTAEPLRPAKGPEPFGLYSFHAPDGLLWTKWRAMEQDLAQEAKAIEDCIADPKGCADGAKRYLLIVEEAKNRQGHARLETVNRLLNRAIRYTADDKQHGVPDRWTAPLASLSSERGDCEDIAIAKYAVLRATGTSESDMRLVLVRDTEARVDHAVLAVRLDGHWVVLDNRRGVVAEITELNHYMPLFALDREGVKLFAAQAPSPGVEKAATPEVWGGGEAGDFSAWTLRGAEFASWELRGSDIEPAAKNN